VLLLYSVANFPGEPGSAGFSLGPLPVIYRKEPLRISGTGLLTTRLNTVQFNSLVVPFCMARFGLKADLMHFLALPVDYISLNMGDSDISLPSQTSDYYLFMS